MCTLPKAPDINRVLLLPLYDKVVFLFNLIPTPNIVEASCDLYVKIHFKKEKLETLFKY